MTAVAEARALVVTEPGVYTIPEDVYHADPVPGRSLSSSGARTLLPPSCPAIFRHEQLHGRPDKRTFDFGHAAHAKVLGVGAPIAVVQKTAKDGTKSDAGDYRTKSAQEHCEEIRAAGCTPLLAAELEQVDAMAEALLAHPVASALFDPEHGAAEQSLFRQDAQTGVWLRSRLDWLPTVTAGRMVLGDYKTSVSAEPSSIAKAMGNYGYHQQAAFYADQVAGLGIADEIAFVFAFQMKTPPYLVTVAEPDDLALRVGRHLNRQAIELYAECVAADTWPGFTSEVELISLPPWEANKYPELWT